MRSTNFLLGLMMGAMMFGLSTPDLHAQDSAVADPPAASKDKPKDVVAATTPAPRDHQGWKHAETNVS